MKNECKFDRRAEDGRHGPPDRARGECNARADLKSCFCALGLSCPHVVSHRVEFLQRVDTVEKLDFLPRSQFLRQQAAFKKKALRVSAEWLTFRCAAAVANWRWQRVRYLPCMTKLRFSDVPHFPCFSTVSVVSRHSPLISARCKRLILLRRLRGA
jgi:hypothetical protein